MYKNNPEVLRHCLDVLRPSLEALSSVKKKCFFLYDTVTFLQTVAILAQMQKNRFVRIVRIVRIKSYESNRSNRSNRSTHLFI